MRASHSSIPAGEPIGNDPFSTISGLSLDMSICMIFTLDVDNAAKLALLRSNLNVNVQC